MALGASVHREDSGSDREGRLVEAFQARYGPRADSDLRLSRAPGRVNLIGEHTDYNDGFVLPIAIDRDVLMVGALRGDRLVRAYSVDYGEESVFDLDDIRFDETMRWSNYVRGVISVLQRDGFQLGGMDIAVTGNVPKGSGLSSSAAIEVATALLVEALCGLSLAPVSVAQLCQRAENEFVGVHCGIMDQFISRLGKRDHALLIDCRSLQYDHVPWPSAKVRVLIADTRVERGLVDSEYNRRRVECEAGVQALADHVPGTRALRDVSVDNFEQHAGRLDPVVRARCAHVVYENQRVLESSEALAKGDWERLGRLMNESHDSLRDLYQVSCRQLDEMVNIARRVEGVYGARMTGAGFGGCAIALVREDAVDALRAAILTEYPKRTGIKPAVLLSGPADGAGTWTLGG